VQAGLELAERRGQYVSQRAGARASNQQTEGKKQFGEREFDSSVVDVEAMREVNEKDSAEHDDDDADGADSQKSAEQNDEAAGKLSQSDEIADDGS